jgi:dTDP-4-amino-4,6-dideoxygalactose transaminase
MADLAFAMGANQGTVHEFEKAIARVLGVGFSCCTGSGAAAMYYILKAMTRLSDKKEVVLPAYTAAIAVLPVLRAGLVPRLADVSLDGFNAEAGSLLDAVGKDTLAVVPTHLFGIPVDAAGLRDSVAGGAFVLEDAAQSMGSKLRGAHTGSMGDAGILSFQRGKNLSTYKGGAALTSREDLAGHISAEACATPSSGMLQSMAMALRIAMVSAVVHPLAYGLMHRMASKLKSTSVHDTFDTSAYTPYRASVGLKLIGRLDALSFDRQAKGDFLLSALSETDGIILPRLPDGALAAFSQFPVIVEDASRIQKLQWRLWERGLETSRLYLRPIHMVYDLGYPRSPDPFPNATYIAEHLLLIPVHHYVNQAGLEAVADTFGEVI